MYNVDPERLHPLSPLAYIGYGLLFLIPGFGIVCAIIVACKASNYNLRSYTRAFLIAYAALVILMCIAALILFARGQLSAVIRRIPDAFRVLFS